MAANNLYFPQIARTYTIVPENYIAIDNKLTGLPLKISITDFITGVIDEGLLDNLPFVQSVTSTNGGIDNTDPQNPILTFPDTYISLSDTSDTTYTAKAGFVPQVNVGETALTLVELATVAFSNNYNDLDNLPVATTNTNFALNNLNFDDNRSHNLMTFDLSLTNAGNILFSPNTAKTITFKGSPLADTFVTINDNLADKNLALINDNLNGIGLYVSSSGTNGKGIEIYNALTSTQTGISIPLVNDGKGIAISGITDGAFGIHTEVGAGYGVYCQITGGIGVYLDVAGGIGLDVRNNSTQTNIKTTTAAGIGVDIYINDASGKGIVMNTIGKGIVIDHTTTSSANNSLHIDKDGIGTSFAIEILSTGSGQGIYSAALGDKNIHAVGGAIGILSEVSGLLSTAIKGTISGTANYAAWFEGNGGSTEALRTANGLVRFYDNASNPKFTMTTAGLFTMDLPTSAASVGIGQMYTQTLTEIGLSGTTKVVLIKV